MGALADQAALEFRQRTKHVKDKPPLRGRRVEGLGQAAEPDTPQPQSFNGFDQLLHRPRQAVELPHDQRVATAREFERVMQSRAPAIRAPSPVDEESDVSEQAKPTIVFPWALGRWIML